MLNKEGNFGNVAVNGGYLEISYNNKIIIDVNVPIPNFSAEKNRDSVVKNDDSFSDDYGNEYDIYIYSSMYGVDYTIELTDLKNESKAKDFLDNLTIKFKDEEEYLDNEFYEESSFLQPSKFFTIKTSQEEGISRLVDFFNDKNTNDIFSFDGLTQLDNQVEMGSLVFVVAGGWKAKISFDYTQGLYGVAKVIKAPYDKKGKSYTIDLKFIYFFTNVIKKEDLYDYKNTINIPNVGITVGIGEQNQAISKIEIEQAKAIMLASSKINNITNTTLFTLFPWVKDEYKSIATENYKSLIDTMPPALNVVNIANVFANYLVNYNSQHTSTLIGIFGKWGRGKTYFFDKVKDYIESINSKEKTFYFCKFQPWKYQKQESAWAYLYETILENYLTKGFDKKEKRCIGIYEFFLSKVRIIRLNFNRLGLWKFLYPILTMGLICYWIYLPFNEKFQLINIIIGILGISGIYFILKTYSFYLKTKHIAQDIINNYTKTNDYSNYLGFQNEIEKELCYLLETYIKNNERLILFIDDLDRCNEKMIIDILDGLRLVLDNDSINSRLTIVTAVDERILKKSIKHKYVNKKVSSNVSTKEYIEKFFLMGIKLNQLNDKDIIDLVDLYTEELNNSNKNEKSTDEGPNNSNKNEKSIDEEFNNNKVITLNQKESMKNNFKSQEKNTLQKEEIANLQILNSDEINSIKEVLKENLQLTPRKINIILHRYLIFKSLVLLLIDETKYNKFDQKMLIEIVVTSQNKKILQKYINHYKKNTDIEILIPLEDFPTDKINREDFIILIKFAEMVSPF